MDEIQNNETILTEVSQVNQNETRSILPTPSQSEQAPKLSETDELIDMSDDFDFNEFQVVRREFFAHLREPSIMFNDWKFFVNAACLSKFPNANYAQVLVNRKNRILVLRPCEEGARDSFPWCNATTGKRKTRSITCRIFFAQIFDMMGWDLTYKYKILGKLIHANGEYLLVFDLTATEVYERLNKDGEKPKMSRTATYPANWQNQFGLTFNEHKQTMHVNIFDGYAVYSIKQPIQQTTQPQEHTAENTPTLATPEQISII